MRSSPKDPEWEFFGIRKVEDAVRSLKNMRVRRGRSICQPSPWRFIDQIPILEFYLAMPQRSVWTA